MSDETGEHGDTKQYITGCRDFASKKRKECDAIVRDLCLHPQSPRPVAQDSCVFFDESLTRLNTLIGTEAENAQLLSSDTASGRRSSPRLELRRGKERKKSPSPTRNKIQIFLAKEYEHLCKIGSKWRKACHAPSQPKKGVASADSQNLQSRIDNVITDILVDIERIEIKLGVLENAIKEFEETINKPDPSPELENSIGNIINSIKNEIYLDYKNVDKQIKSNKEVREHMDKTSKTAELHLEQLHARSHAKKLKGSSPQHSSKAGPSSASQGDIGEASTSTTKKPKKKSKKKKASKTKSKMESPGQKTVSTASSKDLDADVHLSFNKALFGDSSPESVESMDTLSSKVNESIGDLDLSETEDSKDKMEES